MEENKPKATVKNNSIVRELGRYAMKEVIEPKSKEIMRDMFTGVLNMFNDAATKSIDQWIYPDGNSPKKSAKKNGPNDYIPHTNYATRVYSTTTQAEHKPPRESINTRSSTNVQLVWVDDEKDANDIVTTLIEDIDNFGYAKVSRYYEKVSEVCNVHIPTNMTDFTHGWTKEERNLISYYRDKGKYFIDLPKPVNIENA